MIEDWISAINIRLDPNNNTHVLFATFNGSILSFTFDETKLEFIDDGKDVQLGPLSPAFIIEMNPFDKTLMLTVQSKLCTVNTQYQVSN